MKLIQILLPLYDDAGKAFARELYDQVRQELVDNFGGLTAYTRSPATGLWAQQGEGLVRDDVVVYEVMGDELERSWWGGYRRTLEARFQQDALVIRAMDIERL